MYEAEIDSWNKSHVGLIHYNNYWGSYALVLDVDDKNGWVTELDAFHGPHHPNCVVRRHCTGLDQKDKFFSIAEFLTMLEEHRIPAVDVNGHDAFHRRS